MLPQPSRSGGHPFAGDADEDLVADAIPLCIADRHSPDGVCLHVFQQNTDTRAFYESHGFTVLGTNDGDRNMENLPDMTRRWTPKSVQ
ncbi:hypothetical protein [Streptomyces sp. NRRL S-813]|uniref:hypothetical protein n=1 Tax=Streptomyces sp. NRRL S-813 TaxID=1463919 RepID=UPI001F3C3682|nr:hypothetical protein [Streptomyces sp. NRRL S-813]